MKSKISWIIPIKNEAQSLEQLFREIKVALKGQNYEIIAINDASTDETINVLKNLQKNISNLKVINSKTHLGKWASLKKGFEASSGDILITVDSDLQDNPDQINKLLKYIKLDYDIASGERRVRFDPIYKIWLSKLGNLLVSLIFNKNFKDLNSPFKVYRKGVINSLPTHGSMLRFALLFASLLGYKFLEVPIIHRPRIYGRSKFGPIKYLRIIYDLILIRLYFAGSGRLSKLKV